MSYPKADRAFQKKIGDQNSYTDKLVSQLSFIKKNLRYPIDKKKFLPILTIIPASLFPIYFLINNYNHRNGSLSLLILMICLFLFVPAIVALFRLRQTFFFIPVASDRMLLENEQQLVLFLQSKQLRFEQHPDAPELFWIMSRCLHRKSDTREVIFFIVEDHRLLVNGHFTDMNRRVPAGMPHHKAMAKELKKWLLENSEETGVTLHR